MMDEDNKLRGVVLLVFGLGLFAVLIAPQLFSLGNQISLKYLESDAAAPNGQTTLRALASAKNFGIGTAAQYIPLISATEPNYSTTLKREYNMLTPENEMKWDTIHPQQGTYNFAPADTLVRFAKENNMTVRGHTLVWYYQLPAWLTQGNFTSAQLETILKDHITTVVQYYKTNYPGRVVAWDVVNEAFSDNGALRTSIWSKIGTTPDAYIRKAFQWAHDADPSVKLFYNDYNMESNIGKAKAVANLLKSLKRDGIRIDGVGFQGHVSSTTNLANLKTNMALFTGAGFEVQFTEVDVPLTTLDQQATTYRTLASACAHNSLCTAFVTWGFTDKYSWKSAKSPLPFDANYAPKPAYTALKEVLGGSTPPVASAPISRATAGQLLITFDKRALNTSGGPHFDDVKTSDQNYPYVETMFNAGITSGCGTRVFCPTATITRAQFVTFVVRDKNYTLEKPTTATFKDVPIGHPFYQYIETASKNGLVSGYGNGLFGPDDSLTLFQANAILLRAFGK